MSIDNMGTYKIIHKATGRFFVAPQGAEASLNVLAVAPSDNSNLDLIKKYGDWVLLKNDLYLSPFYALLHKATGNFMVTSGQVHNEPPYGEYVNVYANHVPIPANIQLPDLAGEELGGPQASYTGRLMFGLNGGCLGVRQLGFYLAIAQAEAGDNTVVEMVRQGSAPKAR